MTTQRNDAPEPQGGGSGVGTGERGARLEPSKLSGLLGAVQLGRFSGLGLIGLMLIIFAFWIPHTFFTATTFQSMASSQAITVMLALAVLLSLSVGAFDLSIAQNMGLGAVACLILMQDHVGTVLAIAIAIGICVTTGAANAALIAWLGIESIVATLGMQSVLLAVTEIISKDQYAGPGPSSFQSIASGQPFGVPVLIIYALALAVFIWYFAEHTPAGRRLHATGANREAARLAGINVTRYVAGSLIMGGLIAGVAGVLLAAQFGTVSPTIGPPYLLPTFSAVFLGATQVKPGRFNVGGLLVTVALLAIGSQGVQLGSNGASWVPDMFNGVALIIAVGLAVLVARRRAQRARQQTEAAHDVHQNVS
jgi:ribose transport system permease protein